MKDSKEKYLQTLSPDQLLMLKVFSVICTEWLEKNVAALFVPEVNTQSFITGVERLSRDGWICCDCRKIYCDKHVAEKIQAICPFQTDEIVCLLTVLLKQTELSPLDDQLSRQPFFLVARLLLNCVMSQWYVLCRNDVKIKDLFTRTVIAFAANAELSFYGNKRQPVECVENRSDFKMLSFLNQLYNNQPDGIVNRLTGQLFNANFRYIEAKRAFLEASVHSDDDGALLLAEAKMQENLGHRGHAFQNAYRAYLWNRKNHCDDANIEVCLYIACLCGLSNSQESCRSWRDEARRLIGGRRIPYAHPFSIKLKEVKALLNLDSKSLALQILDDAEQETSNLYGGEAPEIGYIAVIRSCVFDEAGQQRKSRNAYRRYVEINHFNYGVSTGDTAVLYSDFLNENLLRGNRATAALYASKLRNLHSDSVFLAPAVRFCEAIANCAFHYDKGDFRLSRQYLEVTRNIYKRELKVNNELIAEIAPVFQNGVIPQAVLMNDYQKIMNLYAVNICLSEGNISEAREVISKQFDEAKDCKEKLYWMIQKGYLLVSSGKQAEGIYLWWKILGMSPDVYRFSMAREIADIACSMDLLSEAQVFYEEALKSDTVIYGKASEIADTFCSFAQVLQHSGCDEKTEDLWRDAVPMMSSMDDNDGLAMFWLSWAQVCDGCVSESLLKKAVEHWEPEHELYDETLSKIYHRLCCVQAKLGKTEEAKMSAQKAVSLFPGHYPPEFLPEIADYI